MVVVVGVLVGIGLGVCVAVGEIEVIAVAGMTVFVGSGDDDGTTVLVGSAVDVGICEGGVNETTIDAAGTIAGFRKAAKVRPPTSPHTAPRAMYKGHADGRLVSEGLEINAASKPPISVMMAMKIASDTYPLVARETLSQAR